MYAKRIIPCLDVKDGRVVKGTSFVNLRDAGDPVEAAIAYDKQGADELVFLDITASSGLAFFNGEYKEGELIAYLPYSIFVTETTSPATPARARTAQTAVQTAASWFAASRSMR